MKMKIISPFSTLQFKKWTRIEKLFCEGGKSSLKIMRGASDLEKEFYANVFQLFWTNICFIGSMKDEDEIREIADNVNKSLNSSILEEKGWYPIKCYQDAKGEN